MTTILFVDDEIELRRIVRTMLERAGYRVLDAAEGTAAIALYREHRPQLVITDIFMPTKDGIELLRDIRALDPQAKIVVISGGGSRNELLYLKSAQQFGVAATLAKPFKGDALLAVVRRVLEA